MGGDSPSEPVLGSIGTYLFKMLEVSKQVFYIEKGLLGAEYAGRPFEVNMNFSSDQIHIPFDRMIVVGDGYTDIPCFSLVSQRGGVAIGVFDPKDWGDAWSMARGKEYAGDQEATTIGLLVFGEAPILNPKGILY